MLMASAPSAFGQDGLRVAITWASAGSDRGDDAGPVGHGSLGGLGVGGESLPAVRDSQGHVQFDRGPGAGSGLRVGNVLVAEDVKVAHIDVGRCETFVVFQSGRGRGLVLLFPVRPVLAAHSLNPSYLRTGQAGGRGSYASCPPSGSGGEPPGWAASTPISLARANTYTSCTAATIKAI